MARAVVFAFRGEARAFQAALASSAKSLRELDRALLRASQSARAMGPALGSTEKRSSTLAEKITAVASSFNALATVARAGGAAVTRSIGAVSTVVEETVGKFAAFDAMNRRVQAVMGTSKSQAAEVAKAVTSIGIESEFTIRQVQDAALALAQLGTTEKTIRPLLRTVVNLASVTGTDLARAAEIAKAQMNAFGLTVRDLPKLQAVLIQASTKSAATLERLAAALQYAGPAAAATGNKIEDVVPAIEALIDSGLDASIAGTTIRNVFTQLLRPTSDAAAAIKGLGIRLKDVNPAGVKLIDIIGRFEKAQIKAADAVRIFGKRFGTSFLRLVQLNREGQKGADALRAYQAELGKVSEAERKVQTIRAGVSFGFMQLQATIEAGKVVLGKFGAELFNVEGRLATAAKTAGALVSELSNLKTPEFREIVVRVLSQRNLSRIWVQAVESTLPAMAGVVEASMEFGARKLVEFAPLVAQPMGKAFVRIAGRGLVAVARFSATSFVTVIESAIKGMASITESLLGDVAVIGPGIRAAAQAMKSTAEGLGDSLRKGIRDGGTVAGDALEKSITDALGKASAGDLLAEGLQNAERLFGDAGTFSGIVSAGKIAGREITRLAKIAVQPAQPVLVQARRRQLQESQTKLRDVILGKVEIADDDLARLVERLRPRQLPIPFGGVAQAVSLAPSIAALGRQLQAMAQAGQQAQRSDQAAAAEAQRSQTDQLTAMTKELAALRAQLAAAQTVDPLAQAGTVIHDNRVQTNFGVSAREAVKGPRRHIQAKSAGGGTSRGFAR